jgi:hypothetical protein
VPSHLSVWTALWHQRAYLATLSNDSMPAAANDLADATFRTRLADVGQDVFPRDQQTPDGVDRGQQRRERCDYRQRFFSASSRNASGTEWEGPNATDPYPTASHPNRSRILSTARSAIHKRGDYRCRALRAA